MSKSLSKRFLFCGAMLLICLLLGCDTTAVPEATAEPAIMGKFAPPAGRTLFIVGQDNDTIEDYLTAVSLPPPGGITSYTSLARLEGLTTATDYGAGTIHLNALATQNPESSLALGFYLVDYLDEINAGTADEAIDQLLAILAAYDRPIFLRFGYEFDGSWNRYEPESFKAAWRHFHQRMVAAEVTNVALVWQSATSCSGRYSGAPIDAWYPGDEVVDWVGLSWFTQNEDCALAPLEEMFAFAREHNKPLMIAEAAPQRFAIENLTYSGSGRTFQTLTADKIWADWYEPFFSTIEQNKDVIRAVAYINTHWDTQQMWGAPYSNGYWGDSRVQANGEILARWETELANPFWLHGSDSLFETLSQQN